MNINVKPVVIALNSLCYLPMIRRLYVPNVNAKMSKN
jgi:hypothetical protein